MSFASNESGVRASPSPMHQRRSVRRTKLAYRRHTSPTRVSAQRATAVAVDVDAARWTAWIVLADEQQHRSADALDVGDRVRDAVPLRDLARRAAKECGVVLLERLHLVLVRRDVVADRNDADAERPPLRLCTETKEREVAAP